MGLNNLHDLFEHEVKALHAAETLALAALRQMADETGDAEFRQGLETHARETEEQIRRLETVLGSLHATPGGGRAPVMEGLAEERRLFLEREPSPEMLTMFNVAASLKAERVEITCYENALELARQLGAEELAAPLRASLREEQAMLSRAQQVFHTLGSTKPGSGPRTQMRRSNVGR